MTITADLDLFSDEVLTDPQRHYAALREQAAAVHLPKTGFPKARLSETGQNGVWAITRYDAARKALANTRVFSSKSVAFNDDMNAALANTSLAADPPEHRALRTAVMENLTPRALSGLADEIEKKADAMVADLVDRAGSGDNAFDAIADLAQALPIAIVMDLIGVQGEVRDKMLGWGFAAFNVLGPMNQRTLQNFPVAGELFGWASQIKADDLADGSIGRAVFEAGARGAIPPEACGGIIHQYVAAGLDSTIASLGNAIALLAAHPDQYEVLRANPDLIPAAYNEVLRYESPVPLFGRLVTEDADVEGTVIPAGSQAAILMSAANRDSRHYPDADTFDIKRNPADHLAFGHGIHTCAGMGLAKLEANALLGALTRRVRRYTVGAGTPRVSNTVRALATLPVLSVEAA